MAESSARKLLAEWFWTDRWTGSSGFLLPMEARGVYREMLTQAWRRGARLPNDHEAIQRAIGVTKPEWRRAWPLVSRFWREEDGYLVSDTQLEIYAEAKAAIDKASERGRKGGIASGKSRTQVPTQVHTQVETRVPTQVHAHVEHKSNPPSPSPIRSVSQKAERHSANARLSVDDELAERAGRFLERYREMYERFRGGARYVSKPSLDYVEAVELVRTWDDERLDRIATVFLTTNHRFAEEGSRTVAQFRSLASWCDSKLRENKL